MINFIKLTSLHDKKEIFLNPAKIGHFYQTIEKIQGVITPYSVIGIDTHNNCGFKVVESVEQILRLINEAGNLDIKKNIYPEAK
jgi:hypothetical protein